MALKLKTLVKRRNQARENGKVLGRKNYPRKQTIRVMTNIAKPWWGNQAMTPSLWNDNAS